MFLLTGANDRDRIREALDGRYDDVLAAVLAPQEELRLHLAFDADADAPTSD